MSGRQPRCSKEDVARILNDIDKEEKAGEKNRRQRRSEEQSRYKEG